MINQAEFIKRLQKILDDNELSASQFADKIGVPRSSISHLLSGRNKPSLEFVLKVNESYPTLTIDWLVLGKEAVHPLGQEIKPFDMETFPKNESLQKTPTSRDIEKIVVFYNDGKFKEYTSS